MCCQRWEQLLIMRMQTGAAEVQIGTQCKAQGAVLETTAQPVTAWIISLRMSLSAGNNGRDAWLARQAAAVCFVCSERARGCKTL